MKNQTLSGYSGQLQGAIITPRTLQQPLGEWKSSTSPIACSLCSASRRGLAPGKWRGETKLAELAPPSGLEADAGRDFARNPTGSLKGQELLGAERWLTPL